MYNNLIHFFNEYPQLAFLISIVAGIFVSIIVIIPNIFLIAANILFFGFWNGIIVSFIGEVLGAGIAFLLYRKGFKNPLQNVLEKYPKVKALINAEGKLAFYQILSLRIIPFVPSGLVTFAAAIGRVSFSVFFVSSALGKIPSLLLEAYSIYEVNKFNWQSKLILLIISVGILFFMAFKKKK